MRKKTTIKDVAKKAGVSISTVSRVLNNRPHEYVGESTRRKVLQTIGELGYRADRRAQSLRGASTGIVGLIMPIEFNPFYDQLSYAIEDIFYKQGYGILRCDSHREIERELAYIDLLMRQNVDGVILTTIGLNRKDLDQLVDRGITLILADEDIPEVNAPAVLANNYLGACQASRYLLDLGHEKIAFVTGPLNVQSGKDRLRGYTDTLKENGIESDEGLIRRGDYTYQKGYSAVQDLLKEKNKFTAIFCSSDRMAFGAMRALQDEGYKVPGDFSIVGFDDMYFSSISNPQLTTVAQPIEKMALRVFEVFKQEVNGRAPSRKKHQLLNTKLVIRESCRPVK